MSARCESQHRLSVHWLYSTCLLCSHVIFTPHFALRPFTLAIRQRPASSSHLARHIARHATNAGSNLAHKQDIQQLSVLLRQRRRLDTGAGALRVQRDPSSRADTSAPHSPHHSQPHIILPEGHAALIEVEQHTDAVALLLCGLHSLPVVAVGPARPVGRLVEALDPPSTSQPGRITPNSITTPSPTVKRTN